MSTMAFQITSHTIVISTVYSGADQRKYQSFASLAFVRVIHRWPVNSLYKRPVTRKMFPFDDVIMYWQQLFRRVQIGLYVTLSMLLLNKLHCIMWLFGRIALSWTMRLMVWFFNYNFQGVNVSTFHFLMHNSHQLWNRGRVLWLEANADYIRWTSIDHVLL